MKIRVLYSSVVCITCIFTVFVFLDFRKQWKTAQTFRQATHNVPLSIRHLFIAPKQMKVENWQVGESSVYHLKTNKESKQISFHVAAQDNNRFWLRTDGLVQFHEVDIEIWRLLDKTNLRPGNELRGFYFLRNAIPFPFPPLKLPPYPVILEKLGDEAMVTPIGTLITEHYFAYVRSPDGELEPLLELWTNPTVHPLGLVRARWRDASLDLLRADTNAITEISSVLLSEFDRDTPMDGSCTRCHTEGVGGKDLKLEFMNWFNGEALNLTTALFHHRQAKIIKQDNLMYIQLTEKSRRALTRFSGEKGSFWVKPDARGWVRISMDTIAHQGNITVQPNTGHLVLEIQP